MNLKKITLKNAGPFAAAEFSFTAPITYLVGANESGKSTLREWVTGLLFGFSRQKQLRAGLIRWGEKEAQITADILLEGDQQITVRRNIRESSATCMIESDHGAREIGDAPLPYLGEMDRALYSGVYSLRVEDLRFPDTAAWTALQHQLLSGEVLSFLRPVSEVSAQWREQALRIWRPDRRGTPLLSERYARRDELQRQLEEARARQELLNRLTQEEGELTRSLEEGARDLARYDAFLKEAYRMRSLVEQMERYERLCRQAGDLSLFADLPRDLQERWKQLEKDRHETEAALLEAEKENETSQQTLAAFGEQEQAILDHKDAIRDLTAGRSQFLHDQENYALLEAESVLNQAQYRTMARNLLTQPEGAEEILASISPAALQEAAYAYQQAAEKCRRAQEEYEKLEKDHAVSGKPLLGLIPAGILALGGAVVLLVPGLVPDAMKPLLSGGLFAGAAILAALSVGFSLPRKGAQIAAYRREYEKAEQETQEAMGRLQGALQGLSVTRNLLEHPVELSHQVEMLCGRLDALRSSTERAAKVRASYSRFALEASRLSALLLMDPPHDPIGACDALHRALEDAIAKKQAAETVGTAAANRKERVRRLKELEAASMVQILNFRNALSELPGAGMQEKIDELLRRRSVAERAQALRDEVHESSGYDLANLRAQMAASDWPWHEDAIAQAEENSRSIRERREWAHTRLGALREERRMLADQPLPSDIESDIRQLQDVIEGDIRERDQIAVAFGLLRLGEEAWKQEHQPELIRRAGEYLARITGGKYTKLFLPEGADTLWVYHEKSESYLDPIQKRLSKGTLEQIYLSLRLAMLDQLDPPGMPLPLLLDETLVNWDDKRAQGLRAVMDHVSRKRQVLFFTCHPETVARMGENAQVIDLEAAHEA